MKKSHIKLFLIVLLLFPFFINAQKKEPIKILFIGNSFTFFWNMPQLVGAMAESEGIAVEIYQSTVGGSTLEQHYNQTKGTHSREMLEEKKWDYVILQEYSNRTIIAPDKFEEYASKFISLIREKKAKPLLFSTWAYKSNPLMQPIITKEYNKLGDSLNTDVIPVGEIFTNARTMRPDLNFFYDDKHPSLEASYLIALSFYKALFGEPLTKIPHDLVTKDKYNQAIYLSFIPIETSVFLKQVVDQYDFSKVQNVPNLN